MRGGEGLTLNRADIVIHYDLPYSYGKYFQRNGRARAVDKTKPVMIYNLIARKSLDNYLSQMIKKKAQMSEQILDMKQIKSILQDA